ncbi:MAG TPA: patatin-like phospholipase family protein [Bacteroidia bacterium]|nr:patatin-like phospholipase family protein [Bacteroidia bacterium]
MKKNLPLLTPFIALLFSHCSGNKIVLTNKTASRGEYVAINNYKSVEKRNNTQDSTLSLAMSISGGGSRASNFGKGVLLELEKIAYNSNSNVLHEIDYFSTVSGGGHAAGAYIGSLYAYDKESKHEGAYSFNSFYQKNYKDLAFRYKTQPQWFYTFCQLFPFNRNKLLEKRVDNHVLMRNKTHQSILLGDMFIHKDSAKAVKYPMVVASSSCLENKIKVPFAPEVLAKYKLAAYNHRGKTIHNKNMAALPLSVALTSSGTVPMMVPPTVFKVEKKKYMRFVDGGLTDNTGILTALQILDQKDKQTRNKIIIVDDTPGGISDDYYMGKCKRNKYSLMGLVWYGLDSRYTTFYESLEQAADCRNHITKSKIDHVVLDFRTLLREPEATSLHYIQDVIEKDSSYNKITATKAMLAKYEDAANVVPPIKDRKTIFELISNVQTKYEASDLERRILILAGKIVVRMQKENINALLKSN